MTALNALVCSQCGSTCRLEGAPGWSLAVLALTPVQPLAPDGQRSSTTDVLCPACAEQVRAIMAQQGDGKNIEQA